MRYFDLRSSLPKLDREWTEEAPLFEHVAVPRRVWVPVGEGTETKGVGTVLAEGEGLGSEGGGPVAPTRGKIVGTSRVTVAGNGGDVAAVELEPVEGEPAPAAPVGGEPPDDLKGWIQHIERAGVGARRHTCPDLLGQLRQAVKRKIDTVICTLLDGDATLRLNAAAAVRQPEEMLAGMDLLAGLVGARRAWLVTDETAPGGWMVPVRDAVARGQKRRVVSMRNDYPESDPTLLIYTLLRRRMRPGLLPTEVGVLLLDGVAAIALGQLVTMSRPMTRVPVAVHHPGWPATRYADVTVGTRLSDVLGAMGIRAEDFVVRTGDLLRDRKTPVDAVVAAGELTFHVMYPEREANPDPCVRCGWCIEGCPVRIHPAGLLEAAQRGDVKLGRHYGVEACVECGICSYVCPSRLPLLPGIRKLRGK